VLRTPKLRVETEIAYYSEYCGRDKTENLTFSTVRCRNKEEKNPRGEESMQLMQLMLVLFGLVLVVEMIGAILIEVRIMKPAGKNKCKNDEWENDSPGYE
jgi:hypothetical protein